MSALAALFLLAAAPASGPVAAPAPAPQARTIGIARARILAPIRMQQSGDGATATAGKLATHQAPRRDGALVIDAY